MKTRILMVMAVLLCVSCNLALSETGTKTVIQIYKEGGLSEKAVKAVETSVRDLRGELPRGVLLNEEIQNNYMGIILFIPDHLDAQSLHEVDEAIDSFVKDLMKLRELKGARIQVSQSAVSR